MDTHFCNTKAHHSWVWRFADTSWVGHSGEGRTRRETQQREIYWSGALARSFSECAPFERGAKGGETMLRAAVTFSPIYPDRYLKFHTHLHNEHTATAHCSAGEKRETRHMQHSALHSSVRTTKRARRATYIPTYAARSALHSSVRTTMARQRTPRAMV